MSFTKMNHDSLLCYQSSQLTSAHAFTTRIGGVSTGIYASMNLGVRRGDQRRNVLKNYNILGKALGFNPRKIVCAAQVHGNRVRYCTEKDWGKGLYKTTDYQADALITAVPGTALMVYSADCGTLLLEDPTKGVVAACHAGWRGTAAGIAYRTAYAFYDVFDSRPEDVHVAIGPCIGPCCFETDEDVPKAMLDALGPRAIVAMKKRGEKYYVDLKALNVLFLQKAGIPEENIDVSSLCTACDTETFWSHRRQGEQRGSLGAVIVAGGKP